MFINFTGKTGAKEFIVSLRGVFQAGLVWIRRYFVSDALLEAWQKSRPERVTSLGRTMVLLRLLVAQVFTLKNIAFFFLLFLVLLSVAIPMWIAQHFGEVSLESIIFALNSPLSGAADHYFVNIAKQVTLAGLLAACMLRAIILIKKKNKIAFRLLCLLIAATTLGNGAYVADKYDAYGYYVRRTEPSTFIDEHYARVDIKDIVFPQRKKNLIILMLESMENTFYNQALFPEPLIPGLKSLQDKNAAFLNWASIPGSGWTIAAMTCFLFGVNLNLPIHGNAYEGEFAYFLPNATSILDVLDANSYSINFIIGSHSTFSGMKNLFTSHSASPNIYDRLFFKKHKFNDPEFISRWGYRDSFVYEQAKGILMNLSRDEVPFFAMIETIETHSKAVSYEKSLKYGDDRDGFVSADRMATEFISWLQNQEFYKDTVVLVCGDHPYMSKQLGDVELSKSKRSIYVTILNSEYSPDAVDRNRMFTSVDLAPTLLESIECILPQRKFGLGVSLFSDEDNLVERYGIEYMNRELGKYSVLYQSFF